MSECKHCATEIDEHCHYCCDGAQIDLLEEKIEDKKAEIEKLTKESISHKNTAFQYHIENIEYLKCIDDLVQTITEKDIVIEELKCRLTKRNRSTMYFIDEADNIPDELFDEIVKGGGEDE